MNRWSQSFNVLSTQRFNKWLITGSDDTITRRPLTLCMRTIICTIVVLLLTFGSGCVPNWLFSSGTFRPILLYLHIIFKLQLYTEMS